MKKKRIRKNRLTVVRVWYHEFIYVSFFALLPIIILLIAIAFSIHFGQGFIDRIDY